MATAASWVPPLAIAQSSDGAFVSIYSARHYPTDEALYADFTKNTGIKINRVDSDDAGILTRLKAVFPCKGNAIESPRLESWRNIKAEFDKVGSDDRERGETASRIESRVLPFRLGCFAEMHLLQN